MLTVLDAHRPYIHDQLTGPAREGEAADFDLRAVPRTEGAKIPATAKETFGPMPRSIGAGR